MLSINGDTISSYTCTGVVFPTDMCYFVITTVTMYLQRVQYVEVPWVQFVTVCKTNLCRWKDVPYPLK